LSFVEFSALLISKEDRLLAKMTLEREAMGAIPNFVLDIIRRILRLELSIHEHCLSCAFEEEQMLEWVKSVTDEDGDLDLELFQEFICAH
jgi:hypothetical protein